MQVTLTINKSTVMFAIGLLATAFSLSNFASAHAAKNLAFSWEYKIVEEQNYRKVHSKTSDGWEPVGLSHDPYIGPLVLLRRIPQ